MMATRRDHTVIPLRAAERPLEPELPRGELKAEPIPAAQRPKKEPLIRIILPIVMVAAMVAMVLIMALSGRGMSPMMMIFPLMMGMSMLMMIAPPEKTGDIDEQRRVYLRHLNALSDKARDNGELQRRHEQYHHPHPDRLLSGVDADRLWERTPDHPHAFEVRVGQGVAPLCTPIEVEDPGSTEDLDPVCAVSLRRAVAAVSAVAGVPVAVQLRAFHLVTLSGPGAWDAARSILAQAVFFHGPESLGIIDRTSVGQCEWLKWPAHTRDPGQATFQIILADSATPNLSETLVHSPATFESGSESCTIVVAPDEYDPVHQLAHDEGIHLHFDDEVTVATVDGMEALGTADSFCDPATEHLMRAIAAFERPMSDRDGSQGSDLMSLMGMPPVERVDEHALWPGTLGTSEFLTVPIGVNDGGYPVYLDLKEAAQGGMGPHGLCIGATGSGKSELLRTLVTGLAATHSPDELNFILVDFKGGATFLGCDTLPHTSAVITNLEDEAVLVERMHDAISGELNRRQELLRNAGNYANVTDYAAARSADHPELEALPSLVIIVDEFSELLGQHPDFAELFVAVGRLGRSLGVHLLLASQRLEEGKLRGLDSHLSYRIGLKTFSAAESRQVLGVTDAYQLPNSPGAGYLKAHSDGLTRFQAAYVSGPLLRGAEESTPTRPRPLQRYHGWEQLADAPAAPRAVDSSTSLLEEVVALAQRVAQQRGQEAHQVWLPPLPDRVEISQVCRDVGPLRCAIGITDQPYYQRQDPLIVDLGSAGGHVAVAGGPQSGKSTALRSLVASLAATHPSDDLAVYIVDAGNGDYADLARLPHIAGMATRSEPEKLRRIIDEVSSLLTDPPGYRVVLVVDGWHALVGADNDFDDVRNQLAQITSDGPAVGIHVVMSTQRWSAIRPAVRDLIGTRIELRLGEALDSLIDRKKQAALPARPGLGLDQEGRFMLVAHTAKQDVAHIAADARARGDKQVPQLKMLPDRVAVETLAGTHRIPLGIGGPRLEPVGVTSQHMVVTGTRGAGKSTTIATLIHGVAALPRDEARMVILDPRRSHVSWAEDRMVAAYAPTTDAASTVVSSAVTTLTGRLPGPEVSARDIASRSWWQGPDIYLIVDDLELLPEDTFRGLVDLIPHAHDIGLHIFVARKFGGISRALMGRFLSAVKDQQPGVLLMDATREEGALFGLRPGPHRPGRGTLVLNGESAGTVHMAEATLSNTAEEVAQ